MAQFSDLRAHAVRSGNSVEVTISGYLPDTCHQAHVADKYPGGNVHYLVDPGAAQVFIDLHGRPGGMRCTINFFPWASTVSIPDRDHEKVEILVNGVEVLEVPISGLSDGQFIVCSLTDGIIEPFPGGNPGAPRGCSILPADMHVPRFLTRRFGPATHEACTNWSAQHCRV